MKHTSKFYEDILKQNRSNLAASSIRTYSSILRNVADSINKKEMTVEDCVTHHKDILKAMSDLAPRLRKTRLSALVVFLGDDPKNERALDSFRTQMMRDSRQADNEKDEQKMTDKQKEAMIPLSEVMKMYHSLEKEVSPLMKRESIDKRQFQKIQMYVLLSCLLLIPVRRSLDFTEFKIRNIDKQKDNFYCVEKRKPYFYFNCYKTKSTYHQQKEEIPPKLQKIIQKWIDINPHDYLLMNTQQSNKINPTQLTGMLYSFFGRPISTSMLRHIFLTDRYKDIPALKELKDVAQRMAHSLEESLSYVKK